MVYHKSAEIGILKIISRPVHYFDSALCVRRLLCPFTHF